MTENQARHTFLIIGASLVWTLSRLMFGPDYVALALWSCIFAHAVYSIIEEGID